MQASGPQTVTERIKGCDEGGFRCLSASILATMTAGQSCCLQCRLLGDASNAQHVHTVQSTPKMLYIF